MEEFINASNQISVFCRMMMNTKKELPIRASEMGMLIYLVKIKEDKTPNGVAKFFHFTKAASTNMVTSLFTKGYIEKEPCAHDKRSIVLVPTKKAVELVEETYQEYFKLMSLLKRTMGEHQFEMFLSLLEQANTILLEEVPHV